MILKKKLVFIGNFAIMGNIKTKIRTSKYRNCLREENIAESFLQGIY